MKTIQERGFSHIVDLPPHIEVLELNTEEGQSRLGAYPYQIGRYNENRRGLYEQELFASEDKRRCIHIGIDIGAPVETPIYSHDDGVLWSQGILPEPGDYGHSMILKYVWGHQDPMICGDQLINQGEVYWVLYGHLSAASLTLHREGEFIHRGGQIGWLGSPEENGGWTPHLHIQLSRLEPRGWDMPGVVSQETLVDALKQYPDPRWILGPLY